MDATATNEPKPRLSRSDYALLFGYCLLLFGWSLVGGRPLTMHEAVLPQTAREMLASGDWIVPTSGGRPWLERPPLPQWIVAGVIWIVGRSDAEWIVRLPSVLVASAIVLLTGWIGGVCYGRNRGLLAGFILATSFEFTSYAWLAEQDIYLCLLTTAALAMFARIELTSMATSTVGGFFGRRPAAFVGFFALLGATNLAKGLLFGSAMVGIPIATFLLISWNPARVQRYLWFWGWLLALTIGIAWPLVAWRRFPDVLDLWLFDHVGRLNGSYTAINQPFWYYLPALAGALAPWTLAAMTGIVHSLRNSHLPWNPNRTAQADAGRFALCWACAPLVVFSFASGKHHHYLLPMLPGWAMLAAVGMQRFAVLLGNAGLLYLPAYRYFRFLMICTTISYIAIYSLELPASDQCVDDTRLLQSIANRPPPSQPIVVNADIASMDSFRMLFYLGNRGRLIHNLDRLLDIRMQADSALVLTRARDRGRLEQLGRVTVIETSQRTRREESPLDRFTLFEIQFRKDLAWRSDFGRVSPMQAMGRAP